MCTARIHAYFTIVMLIKIPNWHNSGSEINQMSMLSLQLMACLFSLAHLGFSTALLASKQLLLSIKYGGVILCSMGGAFVLLFTEPTELVMTIISSIMRSIAHIAVNFKNVRYR